MESPHERALRDILASASSMSAEEVKAPRGGGRALLRGPYLTDLTDAERECIEGLLPTPENEGRPRLHSLREILNAIFCVARSGPAALCPSSPRLLFLSQS
jgi:hypothetical protein